MSYWLLTVLTVLGTVASQDYGLVHFLKEMETLVECIDQYLDKFWFEKDLKMRSDFINVFGLKLSQRTFVKSYLRATIASTIDYEINNYFYARTVELDRRRPREELEEDVNRALLNCADDYVDDQSNSRPSSDFQALPYFANEPIELFRLLNLILVNWSCIPESMCSTPIRRAELRRYAEDSLRILERSIFIEFNNNQPYYFWDRRARLFFDGRDNLIPYIDHRYSLNHSIPYSRGDTRRFLDRTTESFQGRNPRASREQVDKILLLHPVRSCF